MSNNNSRHVSYVLYVVAFCMIMLVPLRMVTCAGQMETSVTAVAPVLEMRVDRQLQARAYCNSFKTLLSIADFFEFYERDLTQRKRICSGPWEGKLSEKYPGTSVLEGSDPISGASYNIVYKYVDPTTIEVFLAFKAPNRPSNLGFNIVKLNADLFKGATMEVTPAALSDVARIGVTPQSFDNRILLRNKNRVRVQGFLCDLEIIDLNDSKSILVSDNRMVSWDASKSILFCVDVKGLVPGTMNYFHYSVHSLPPTHAKELYAVKATGSIVPDRDAWSFYTVTPKEERKERGQYQLRPQDAIYGMPSGMATTILSQEIEERTSLRFPALAVNTIPSGGRGIVIEKSTSTRLPPEGFEIVTTPNKVTIRGADDRGCLYGVYALLGRLSGNAGNWQLPCGTIRDWPDLPIRGVCVELLKPVIRDVALFKRYLDAISRARGNTVVFLHMPGQVRSWQKQVDDGGWTKEQMTEISRYARLLHLDVWGGMGSSFRSAEFKELDIQSGTKIYNPFKEASYTTLFGLYKELIHTYNPATILIAHDEIQGLSVYATDAGKSTADILAADVGKIHGWLSKQGIATAMWGDMLLNHDEWDTSVGAANSNNPSFNSGATHLALGALPADMLILDWHYTEKRDYASIGYFRKRGFRVIGSPWHNPDGAVSLAKSVKKYSGQGIIATDWGFQATLSPAATTLMASLAAWSKTIPGREDDVDLWALAETMRTSYPASKGSQTPVSLASVSNRSTQAVAMDTGPFNTGPMLDLRAFPSSTQQIGGITFNVGNGERGTKNNCVTVAKKRLRDGGASVTKEVYRGSIAARSIAFLHTAFVEDPQYRLRTIGSYEVEYTDGSVERIDLKENWNITDVRSTEGLRKNDWTFARSPDVLIGSKLVWRGTAASGIPLNVQLYIWRNPYPDKIIKFIRMSAAIAPVNSQIILLGMTFW